MTSRPVAVAFDVIETLMPLEPLRERIVAVGQPAHLLEVWFTRTLRDGMALSATGSYAPFRDVAAAALRTVTAYRVSDDDVDHVLAGFAGLPAHSDVAPAMARLSQAGVRVACLTNGDARVTASFVERAGLASYVEKVITVEEVRRWKPPAVVYQHAADSLGVPAERLALVAAHAWDCHGAKSAGLVSGWVSRLEGRYPPIFIPPDVTGDTLVEVAEALLALPTGG